MCYFNGCGVVGVERRQQQLSMWLQRQVESPQHNLSRVMHTLKLHYEQNASTLDEIMAIELKVKHEISHGKCFSPRLNLLTEEN